MLTELKLPAMGEGIDSGDVVSMLIKPGDKVAEGDTVCELETSKALIEVPSDVTGTVKEVKFKPGDTIPVGAVIAVIEVAAVKQEAAAAGADRQSPDQEQKTDSAKPQPAAETKPQLATGQAGGGQAPAAGAETQQPAPQAPTATADGAASSQPPVATPVKQPVRAGGQVAPAGPATRRYARELGVDVGAVPTSSPDGRITREDVRRHVSEVMAGGVGREPALPDFSKFGPMEIVQPGKVKALTAEHMARSWSVVPHVTQFEDADITALEELRRRSADQARERGGKLTLTVLALKALIPALKQFPEFNASRDPHNGALVLKKYYNIGIATATERGLLVPVIRNADQKSILALAVELAELTERTRNGKASLEDLQGGTFSISNQGGIGGSHFTPIVNHPEAAILALGRGRLVPGYDPVAAAQYEAGAHAELAPSPRLMLPLAVSYDHRIVDGAQAAAFIRAIKETLEDPNRLLLGL